MTDTFINSSMLLLLTVLPLLFVLMVIAQRKRRQATALLLNKETAKRLTDPRGVSNRRISEICLLTALGFIILAPARPVWDSKPIPQPQAGRDLIFMLDVSQSMLAEDQPPNRLEYAKHSIIQCLDELKSGRIGLVAFAGSTSIKSPLTKDFKFFRSALADLAPDSVSIGGTRIGDAINKTIDKIVGDHNTDSYDIIMITDGESHTPLNTNAVSRMADSRANLIIIGMGSDSVPTQIPVVNEDSGLTVPLTNDGSPVHTMQNSKRLSRISELIPGSTYINAGTNPIDLADIYKTHTDMISQKTNDGDKTTNRPIEQYRRFLLAALAFIAASYLPHFHKTSSMFQQRNTLTSIIIAGIILASASHANAKSRNTLFSDGIAACKSGNFDDAVKMFSAAERKRSDPVIIYNLGTAYYRLGDMQNAMLHFTSAAQSTDNESLAIDSAYNAGNSFFMMAIHTPGTTAQQAAENIQHAIAAYQSVIFSKPDHKDAAYNLEAAQKMLALMHKSAVSNNEGEDGDSEKQDEKSEEADESSSADSNDSSSDKSNQDQDEEMSAPNLTPDDIIKEEDKNNLKRSRKKHADFGKVKMNW
jgi:tetratricopeptide (TPR) repeat protein/uncharacterized protein YegL